MYLFLYLCGLLVDLRLDDLLGLVAVALKVAEAHLIFLKEPAKGPAQGVQRRLKPLRKGRDLLQRRVKQTGQTRNQGGVVQGEVLGSGGRLERVLDLEQLMAQGDGLGGEGDGDRA